MLLVMLSGTFMVVLDFFIVMVALPSIQRDLGASTASLQWVVAGYGVANAAGLITGGRLGDMFGRRRMFLVGLALFTVASVACGLAPSIGLLIAARLIQGLAGALLQPQVLAMLGATFTGAARARAFGAYAIAMGIAGVGGQVIGGMLIEANLLGSGWRSCFLINLPIGVVALMMRSRLRPTPVAASRTRIDIGGMALAATALALTIGPLVEGRPQGWPLWSLVCLTMTVPVVGLLIVQQRRLGSRGGQPLLPMVLFSVSPYVRGLLATLTFYAGIASFYFVLALYLQQCRGLSALASGATFSVLAAGFMGTSMQARRLAGLTRGNAMLVGGVTLCCGHLLQAGLVFWGADAVSPLLMLPVLLLEGAGIGMVMAPLASAVLSGVQTQHAGVASGVLVTMQQVGNSLGVALIGILYFYGLGGTAGTRASTNAFALCLVVLAALALIVTVQVNRFQRHGAMSS